MIRPDSRTFALVVPMTALLIACAPTDAWEQNPSCAMVCQRTTECLSSPDVEDYCFAQCDDAASGAGELGQNVVDGCAACVEEAECRGILAGDCAASCPYGVFGGLTVEAGPDSGAPGGPEDRCDGLWTVSGITYEILCLRSRPDEPYVSCDCYVDGIQQGSFRSTDACAVDDAMRADRGVTGCGWAWSE